jgi:hypothetical protein
LRLARFIKQKFPDFAGSMTVKQKADFGTPERRIVERAKSEGADLIIMSSSGKSKLARMFLGSVTEYVVGNAPCPVVAVPRNFAATHEELCGVSGENSSPDRDETSKHLRMPGNRSAAAEPKWATRKK